VLATMFKDQPSMARMTFPTGCKYPIQAGDNLVSIGERFGMPWQRVAEGALKQFAEDGMAPSFAEGQEILIQTPAEEWENSFSPMEDEAMVKLWTGSPDMAALLFPEGLPYLVTEDESLKSLSEKFGAAWDDIAEASMGTRDPGEINDWLEHNGGRKLKSGYWAFADGLEMCIPAPADQPMPDVVSMMVSLVQLTGETVA
jgi:hypothetical protein